MDPNATPTPDQGPPAPIEESEHQDSLAWKEYERIVSSKLDRDSEMIDLSRLLEKLTRDNRGSIFTILRAQSRLLALMILEDFDTETEPDL